MLASKRGGEMQQQNDEYFIESPTTQQYPYPPPNPPKKAGFPWSALFGFMLAGIPYMFLWNPEAKSDDLSQCRQVNLSKTKLKYLVVRDWLTREPLYQLPHGSRVKLVDARSVSDSQHKVLLLSEYKIFNHGKVQGYGVISSGFTDDNGTPQPLFILCK